MHRPMSNFFSTLAAMAETAPKTSALSSIAPSLNRTGPGKRSIDADHRRILDAMFRETPGAERMRAVVARRRANWS